MDSDKPPQPDVEDGTTSAAVNVSPSNDVGIATAVRDGLVKVLSAMEEGDISGLALSIAELNMRHDALLRENDDLRKVNESLKSGIGHIRAQFSSMQQREALIRSEMEEIKSHLAAHTCGMTATAEMLEPIAQQVIRDQAQSMMTDANISLMRMVEDTTNQITADLCARIANLRQNLTSGGLS